MKTAPFCPAGSARDAHPGIVIADFSWGPSGWPEISRPPDPSWDDAALVRAFAAVLASTAEPVNAKRKAQPHRSGLRHIVVARLIVPRGSAGMPSGSKRLTGRKCTCPFALILQLWLVYFP